MYLNAEQKKIVTSKPAGHFLVKGVAGSGKTTIALYRIPFLLHNYCFAPDDAVLLLTYTKTLAKYIQYLYDKIDEEDKMDFLTLFGAGNDRVEIDTVDALIYKYFSSYNSKQQLHLTINSDNHIRYQVIQYCIHELQKEIPDVPLLDQKYATFLLHEIDWIKACHYLELEEYQTADRLGRTIKIQAEEGPQKLPKNSRVRYAIFELMRLFKENMAEKGLIDFNDAAILALEEINEHVEKQYSYIIVDESQDLTRVQLEFIAKLLLPKENASIMFVCDTTQSIYPHAWLVKGRSFASVGFDMTGKSYVITKNYRTTLQIAQAAYSLIENDPIIMSDEHFVVPDLIEKQGCYPVFKPFRTPEQETEYVWNEIWYYLLQKVNYKDIAIIARKRKQLAALKEYFDGRKIPTALLDRSEVNFEENSVKLLTMHAVKGLEFKAVFIIGLNQKIMPFVTYQDTDDQEFQESTEKRLLYVGMTRASEMLYLTTSGPASKFINEISPDYLRLATEKRIRAFHQIRYQEYLFREKIKDIYTDEEKVRQWFIKELINTYHYPLSLIDVEYPVYTFSKAGAVDIVVYRKGEKKQRRPFLFVELKAVSVDIKDGLSQLKSYMSNDAVCSYGVVTNGREMMVLNNRFEVLDDFPDYEEVLMNE